MTTPLLDKWYPRHLSVPRTLTLEAVIFDLWRQYPAWPSTFSQCASETCTNRARGGALCPSCVETALTELAGPALAGAYAQAVLECAAARHALYDALSESDKVSDRPS